MPGMDFRAEWLKKNNEVICFEDSCDLLRSGHEISDFAAGIILPKIKRKATLTWEELSDQLNTKYQYDFINDNITKDDYAFWIGCSVNNSHTLDATQLTTFDEKALSFSIPFLKCLYQKAGSNKESKVTFYHLIIPGKEVMFVEAEGVTTSSSKLICYDYTTRPQIILYLLTYFGIH